MINEGNLQGRRNASTAPLFVLRIGVKYYAADSSYFRDEGSRCAKLWVDQLNPRFLDYITWTRTDSGCQLHDGIAMHQDSARDFGCMTAWQCIKGSDRALSG